MFNFQLVKCCATCRHRVKQYLSSDRIICKKHGTFNPDNNEALTTYTYCLTYSKDAMVSTHTTPFHEDDWELFD